jgi:MFS transporter, FHS family, glucose/mannose:H+ symporter
VAVVPARGRSTAALHGAFIVSGAATVILGPLIPELSARWHLPVSALGVLFLIQFGSCGLGAWISGAGPRWSVVAGYALVSLGLAGLPLGWGCAQIAVALVGFGLGLSITSTNVLVARMNPSRRGSALSYLNLLWGIGAVGCPMLFAALDNRAWAAGGAPWVLAAAAALAAVAVGRTVPAPSPAPEVSSETRVAAVRLLPFALLTAQLFAYTGTECAVGGWVATLCREVDPDHPAFKFVVNDCFWGAFLGVRLLAPAVLTRISEPALHLAALVGAAAGLFGLLAFASPLGLVLGAVVTGAGLAPLFPLLASEVVGGAEGAPSRTPGTLFAIGGLGSGVVPWLTAQVAEATGSMRQAFLVPAGGVVAMALLWWLYRGPRAAQRRVLEPRERVS